MPPVAGCEIIQAGGTFHCHLSHGLTAELLDVKTSQDQDAEIKTLVEPPLSPHFYLWQIDLDGTWKTGLKDHPYLLVSVIKGEGKLKADGKSYDLKMGTNLIIPNEMKNFTFTGKMRIVMSAPGEE